MFKRWKNLAHVSWEKQTSQKMSQMDKKQIETDAQVTDEK